MKYCLSLFRGINNQILIYSQTQLEQTLRDRPNMFIIAVKRCSCEATILLFQKNYTNTKKYQDYL